MDQDTPLFVIPLTLGVGSVTLNGVENYEEKEQDEQHLSYCQVYDEPRRSETSP